jgi:hypothetical protein
VSHRRSSLLRRDQKRYRRAWNLVPVAAWALVACGAANAAEPSILQPDPSPATSSSGALNPDAFGTTSGDHVIVVTPQRVVPAPSVQEPAATQPSAGISGASIHRELIVPRAKPAPLPVAVPKPSPAEVKSAARASSRAVKTKSGKAGRARSVVRPPLAREGFLLAARPSFGWLRLPGATVAVSRATPAALPLGRKNHLVLLAALSLLALIVASGSFLRLAYRANREA